MVFRRPLPLSEPIIFGERIRHFVPRHFERALIDADLLERKTPTSPTIWTKHALLAGIRFDLSAAEWFDLGVLGTIALLVESAGRDGIRCEVAVPRVTPTRAEQAQASRSPSFANRLIKTIAKRAGAASFLEYMRFPEAIEAQHLLSSPTPPRILREYEPKLASTNDADVVGIIETNERKPTQLYKYCFPFRWLSAADSPDVYQMAGFLSKVVGDASRGLQLLDAKTLSNVILYELLDNVQKHAQVSGRALVAAWVRPPGVTEDPKSVLSGERSFVQWIGATNATVVDLFIGDSGAGVVPVLRDSYQRSEERQNPVEAANVLDWAFGRWSSSNDGQEERGTRGLYRVHRVVQKYQGMVTMRSDQCLVGWDHGGPGHLDRVRHDSLALIPGTAIRLRLLAHDANAGIVRSTPSTRSRSDARLTRLGPIVEDGFSEAAIQAIRKACSHGISSETTVAVGIVEGGAESNSSLTTAFRSAASNRHPGALVLVGLPGGWDLIENAIDSTNQQHELRRKGHEDHLPTHFDVWDPVLILGQQGQAAWVGSDASVRSLLDYLLKTGGRLSREDLTSHLKQNGLDESILRHLRHDRSVVRFLPDNSIEMAFSLDDIWRRATLELKQHVERGQDGISPTGAYCTPSLFLTSAWLEIPTVISGTTGNELALMALAAKIESIEGWGARAFDCRVLADTKDQREHVEILSSILRLQRDFIPSHNSPGAIHDVPVARAGSSVIVYSDVIGTGESVLRHLSHVLRDGASPLCIATIFDARTNRQPVIEMWDQRIPVVSLVELDLKRLPDGTVPAHYISPTTKRIEAGSSSSDTAHVLNEATTQYLVANRQALNFSHFESSVGRHFTFFLDPQRLAASPEIASAMNDEISRWVKSSGRAGKRASRPFELWYPSGEGRQSEPARVLAGKIMDLRADVDGIHRLERSPGSGRWSVRGGVDRRVLPRDVVFIDWGAVTGATIMQAIINASESGAPRVLVCVFSSQLPSDEERFFSRLGAVNGSQLRSRSKAIVPRTHSQVTVKFLSRFDITAYSRLDCPICQETTRLSHEEFPTELLRMYAQTQLNERLAVRTRVNGEGHDSIDLDGRVLPQDLAMKMARLRGRLVSALSSTSTRASLAKVLEGVLRDQSRDHGHPDALAWVRFLSVETQWIKKPPLHFSQFRKLLAEISLKIARDSRRDRVDRQNALVVLRTVSKLSFAENSAKVFESAFDAPSVQTQLLYNLFTCLSGRKQSPQVLRCLQSSLGLIQAQLERRGATSAGIAETAQRLSARADFAVSRAELGAKSKAIVWGTLSEAIRSQIFRKHNSLSDSMRRMLPGPDATLIQTAIESIEEGESAVVDPLLMERIRRLSSVWEPCRIFIDSKVLPAISELKAVWLSEDFQNAVSEDSVKRIVMMSDSGSPFGETDFSRMVQRLRDDPLMLLHRRNWDLYRSTVAWLWENLFHDLDETDSRAGLFAEFVMSAPCELGQTVHEIYSDLAATVPTWAAAERDAIQTNDMRVYCPRELVRNLVRQAFANVRKHVSAGSAAPKISVTLARDSRGRIVLTILNSMTKASAEPGRGLSDLKERLRAFEAELTWKHVGVEVGSTTFELQAIFLEGSR